MVVAIDGHVSGFLHPSPRCLYLSRTSSPGGLPWGDLRHPGAFLPPLVGSMEGGLVAKKVTAGTLGNYERHWRKMRKWMVDMGVSPVLGALTVSMFILCLTHIYDAGYCYSAANLTRSAVALAYRLAQMDPPYVTDHPSVKAALKGFKRLAAPRAVRRCGIRKAARDQLLTSIYPGVPPFLWLQVFCAMMLGSVLLLRVSEVLGSLGGHFSFEDGAVLLFLPTSKTDQLRKGVYMRSTHPHLIQCLRCLCAGIHPDQPVFTVSADYLNDLIKRGACALGWKGYYSFHSFRHGTATDIWLRTRDLQQVQLAGRWLTKAAARWYIHIIQVPADKE